MNDVLDRAKTSRFGAPDFSTVWIALALLILGSLLFAPGTLSASGLLAMIPFASVLAIASIGQCLTIQSGGMDLSVAGSMSLAAAVVTTVAGGENGNLPVAVALALVAALLGGLLNGLAITVLRIPPIVVTIAVNAILLGLVQSVSGGVLQAVPSDLANFAGGTTLGIPRTVIIAVIFVVLAAFVINKSTAGRRLAAVGARQASARAAGIAVTRYLIGAYTAAGLCFGCAGVILAGYLQTPSTSMADTYLFSTITAVIIGGTAFGGGRGRIVGTALGAVFVSQLNVFLTATGAPSSVTYIVQAIAIAIAVVINNPSALSIIRRQLFNNSSSQGRVSA